MTVQQGKAATSGAEPAGGWALASLSMAMLLPSLGTSIANVGLPAIARAFDASVQEAQWVVVVYLLAVTTLIVKAGRLGDMMGRRRLLLFGIAVFTAASIACGIAADLGWLVAARAGQGVGAAIMMALTMASVSEVIPGPRIGAAMGLLGTMSAVGTALGPALGGVLVSTGGWPAIFLATAALGGPTLLLAYRSLPADDASTKLDTGSFDGVSAVLLFMTLAAFAPAATGVAGIGGGILLLLAAIVGLGLFVKRQTSVAHPLVDMTMLREVALAASLSSTALVSTVLMATLVVGPFYLSGALGLEPAMVGAVMSIGPVVAALTGHAAGRFVDRFGPYPMTLLGLGGVIFGALLLALLWLEWAVASYVIGIVVMTAGYALFQAANNTSTMKQSPPGKRGVVAGLLGLARNLGLITGASAMGALFALAAGGEHGGDPATGMRVTFLVAAILAGAAAAVHVLKRRAATEATPS